MNNKIYLSIYSTVVLVVRSTAMSLWSQKGLKELVVRAENEFKMHFSRSEVDQLLQFTRQLRMPDSLTTIGDQCDFAVSNYKSYLRSQQSVDVKEMMIEQIMDKPVSSFATKGLTGVAEGLAGSRESFDNPALSSLSAKDLIELTRVINRESLCRDSNILLDSRYQSLSNQDRSRIVFNIVSDTRSKSPGSGTIISSGALKDLVEVEIFPFSIPYLTAADNYYNIITMSILELSSSAIDAYENAQFHFLFKATKNKNLLELEPVNKVFRFHKPIAKINEFSIRFGSPLAPITFDKDRLFTRTINYTSNPMTIEFSEDHNLLSGDIIYITEFTTLNPARDLAVIAQINSLNGHICTRQSSTVISINVDASDILFPDASLRFQVYLGSKRLLIPIRLKYIDSSASA